MKKILLVIFLLLGYFAQAQTVGQFRYDTTKFLKVGGRNHVMIENLIQVTDSTYKALVIGADGVIKKITYWPGTGTGGSSSGITSLGSGWGLNNVNDSTYEVDSTEVATQYDLEGYIPLSGTVAGKPVTGDVEFDKNLSLSLKQGNSTGIKSLNFSDDFTMSIGLLDTVQTYQSKFFFQGNEIGVSIDDPTTTGLLGDRFFAAKTPNSFAQKHDIDLYADSIRQELADTAAAIRGVSPWQSATGGIHYSSGNVGITENTPGAKLHIKSDSIGVGNNYDKGVIIENSTASNPTGPVLQESPGLVFKNTYLRSNNSYSQNVKIYGMSESSGNVYGGLGFSIDGYSVLRLRRTISASTLTMDGFEITASASNPIIYAPVLTISGLLHTNSVNRFASSQTKFGANASPHASAIVDIQSTSKGFLQPQMTTTQKNAISSPANGLAVYDTDKKQPNYYDGVTWKAQVGMTFGTAAPAITPAAIGNFFLDTTNKKLYVSIGTSSSADWEILN